MNQTEKDAIIEKAAHHYKKFMYALGLKPDSNPHEKDTARRVAKSFVNDLFVGLYNESPDIRSFPNEGKYDGMVFQGNIEVNSICAHHHLPFVGNAYVAYLPAPDGLVVGLSKLNRVVEHFARRPQVQETLTMDIHKFLDETCEGNKGVAVMIQASHMCACLRGVKHDSTMITSKLSGGFLNENTVREEFYNFVNRLQ